MTVPDAREPESFRSALIVDWGGVLTNDLDSAMRGWAADTGVDMGHFAQVMRQWLGVEAGFEAAVNPVHALERGEIEVPAFEQHLADGLGRISGEPVEPEGLLDRMFEYFEHAPQMSALVRRAKEHGIKTALLSNSWGNSYPDHLFDGMFDVIVISGQVGMRKPDAEIFDFTVDQLGVTHTDCVFVDDIARNVHAAVELGQVGILHESYESTANEVSAVLGVDLA